MGNRRPECFVRGLKKSLKNLAVHSENQGCKQSNFCFAGSSRSKHREQTNEGMRRNLANFKILNIHHTFLCNLDPKRAFEETSIWQEMVGKNLILQEFLQLQENLPIPQ